MNAIKIPMWGMAFLALSVFGAAAQAATTCVTASDAPAYRFDTGRSKMPADIKAPCALSDSAAKLADVQTAIRTKGTIIANVAELTYPSDVKIATQSIDSKSGTQSSATTTTAAPETNTVQAAPMATSDIASTAQAAAPVPAGPPKKTFEIRTTDLSIYAALKRWSNEEGYQISWEIPSDYPTTILDSSEGTFEDAVTRVLEAFKGADYPPKGCFYENHVLRVVRRTGDGKECFR